MGNFRITLKAARVNAKLSQKEAAKRIGVCVSTIQNYESGKCVPDWDVVRKLEEVYGVKADNIFFNCESALSVGDDDEQK